jgi:hypothetical protein
MIVIRSRRVVEAMGNLDQFLVQMIGSTDPDAEHVVPGQRGQTRSRGKPGKVVRG